METDRGPRRNQSIDAAVKTATPPECAIVELRQYSLHPGARETLIELFDREFVETQEACGMRVLGQFRDLDHPDRFVWLRGFPDMPRRAQSLAAFYGGPVWKAHRETANATMVDSDNVLLLRPAWPGAGFDLDPQARSAWNACASGEELVAARLYSFDTPVDAAFIEWFRQQMTPLFAELGAQTAATFVTETAQNTFPALPVREGERVLVWFARFDHHAAFERFFAAVTHSKRWNEELLPILQQRVRDKPPLLRLAPTARSLLR